MYDDEKIRLKGRQCYITNDKNDAFYVVEGSVFLHIVPLENSYTSRKSFLYEAKSGEIIPSFCYKDIEYVHWRFCISAVDEAVIQVVENGCTNKLRHQFLEKVQLDSVDIEGFEGCLVNRYRENIVKEDTYIIRTEKEKKNIADDILSLIYTVFNEGNENITKNKTNMLYDSVSFLCKKKKIKIASYNKVKEMCGEDPDMFDIARVSNFSCREVVLEDGWQKQDCGAFIALNQSNKPIICIPKYGNQYTGFDIENKKKFKITKKIADSLQNKVYVVYRLLPLKKLQMKDLFKFSLLSVNYSDVAMLILLSVVTGGIALVLPKFSQYVYDQYIPLGAISLLYSFGIVLASFMIGNLLFYIVKNLYGFRVLSNIQYDLQIAIYERLFNLPENFFRKYDSADTAQRVLSFGNVVSVVTGGAITIAVMLITLVIYIVSMIGYSLQLAVVGLLLVFLYGAIYFFITSKVIKYSKKSIECESKANSVMYQLLNGIQKIRMSGVEDRAIFEFLQSFVKVRKLEKTKSEILNFGSTLDLVFASFLLIILYFTSTVWNLNISIGGFLAFCSVLSVFAAAIMQLVNALLELKMEQPNIERWKPILDTIPELYEGKEAVKDITGQIELNNISFAYNSEQGDVINNVSLNIKSGEYVGIVGPSGCGKSTLLKLLLGFEKPDKGKIYYDNEDLENLQKRELRKNIGVVLQDGSLISGSIFENIAITNPAATIEMVCKAVSAVGLEEDISQMPMGLHTVLSEDCKTISGGQQQRILIARAMMASPKIMLFDEATSALDNITQKMVCDTLESLNATRIVIAHRLSTIIHCDRIIVMNKGAIVEQGKYEELMEKRGLFYQLASRQI